MADYFPTNDRDKVTFMQNFATRAEEYSAELGITAADIQQIQTYIAELSAAIDNAETLRQAAIAATNHKNDVAGRAEDLMRDLVDQAQGNRATTDEMRIALRISLQRQGRRTSTAPQVPTNLSAVFDREGDIVLKWDANGNPLNTMWTIYMRKDTGEFQLLDVDSRRKYTYKNPPRGATLTFYVTAKRSGQQSAHSNYATIDT